MPYNKPLTNRACSGRTGEYWPSVVAVRTSLRSVRTATTEGQYSPVRPSRSVSKRLILLGQNFSCFDFLSLEMYFGFTFNTKLSIFEAKTRERKLYYRQINRIRLIFFIFQAVIAYISSNHGACHIKATEQVPTASIIECLECLYMICDICKRYVQRNGGYLM